MPSSSVIRRGGLAFVFDVDQSNHAHLRPIVVGAIEGDQTEVLAGAARDTVVVMNPPPSLADGALVAPTRAAAGQKPDAGHE